MSASPRGGRIAATGFVDKFKPSRVAFQPMRPMAIFLAFAVLAMLLSPVFGMTPAVLHTSHSAARLLATVAALALVIQARGRYFLPASMGAAFRAPASRPPFLLSIPVTDLDCVRVC